MTRSISFAGLFLLALLLPSLAPGGALPFLAPEAAPYLTVAFVGNENVDLMWTDVSTMGYQVWRDSILLSGITIETINGQKFFRDTSVVKGVRYNYQVCALTSGAPECSANRDVNVVGDVEGHLYKDLTWDHGKYVISGDVIIESGVTLSVLGGSIEPVFTGYSIQAIPGALQIQGSAGNLIVIKNITLEYYASPSSISYADMWSNGKVIGNVNLNIHHSKIMEISLSGGASTITDNDLVGLVSLSNSASANISDNSGVSGVKLRGASTATIMHNTNLGIVDMGGKQVTMSYNSGSGGVLVWPKSGSTATVENNTFTNSIVALYGAVDAGNADPPPITTPSSVFFRNNLITRADTGVNLGPEIHFELTGNTIVYSTIGILGNNAVGYIQNNCIAGNTSVGLSWLTNYVDATFNWWGHQDGPSRGDLVQFGDRIVESGGGIVNANNFLTSDNCEDSVRNLKVARIEVTQPTQNMANSVPLIAGRETRVRVYLASSPRQVPNVTASLTVSKDGQVLGVLTPSLSATNNPQTYMDSNGSFTFAEPLRGQRGSSLVFKLPPAWAQGTVKLVAEANPSHSIKENNYEDNFMDLERTFQPGGPVENVGVVPVNYTAGGGSAAEGISTAPTPQQILDAFSLLRQIYPGASLEPALLPGMDWPYLMKKPGDYNPKESRYAKQLINKLRLRYLLEQALNPSGPSVTRLYAMFPSGVLTYGMAEPPSRMMGIGRAAYSELCPVCLAHEVLDNVGFGLAPVTYTNEYGYDIENDQVIPPTAYDVSYYSMTPPGGAAVWVGPQTYQALLDNSLTTSQPERAQAAQAYVIASAIMYKEWDPGQHGLVTKVAFEPAWEVTTEATMENPPVGTDYCLDLLDAAGATLSSYCFDQPALDSSLPDSFAIVLPLTGTPARLALRTGGSLNPEEPSAEIGSQPVSAHPPQVTLDSPNGGENVGVSALAQWHASDSDPGTQLTFNLLYSPDNGASWEAIATGITTTQKTVDFSLIPGSTSARLRVIASDGFHTASDDSNGAFAVSSKNPMATILSPANFTQANSGKIDLLGSAYDVEDGALDGSALVWTSSLDGPLGTGSSLTQVSLSPGPHLVTLTATDSQGHTGSDSITVINGQTNFVYLPLLKK